MNNARLTVIHETSYVRFDLGEFDRYEIEGGFLLIRNKGKLVGCFTLDNIIGFYCDEEGEQ